MQYRPITGRPAARGGACLLRAEGLAKSYGATRAVTAAAIELRAGSIVGMVGENGSGKSTLVKLLAGVTRPDRGTIAVGGRERAGFRRPREALEAGIGTVFQEILVAPARSVFENVVLGSDRLLRAAEPERERRRRVAELLAGLAGRELDLDAPVETLGIAERQLVTVARALARRPPVLILDESTSSLDVSDRDRLFERCREFKAGGMALLFITHRLEELMALADEILVIRDGRTVEAPAGGVSRAAILGAMSRLLDEDAELEPYPPRTERPDRAAGAPVLRADGVSVGGAGTIDLELRAGTIVGLAGLEGHGQERFLRALGGVQAPEAGHVVRVDGDAEQPVTSLHRAARLGLAYLPRDRARAGIFPALSVLDNFALPTLDRSSRLGLLDMRSLHRRLAAMCDTLHIRAAGARAPITTLSGGNQQKVLLARWLAAEPRVLLLDDPTRGVDLPTKAELHALLRREADAGMAVVMVSTELEELASVCDSALVFHEGSLSARLDGPAVTRDAILAAMFGDER